MKRIIIGVAFVLAFIFNPIAHAQTLPSSGLVSRYTLDTANINWANTTSEIKDSISSFSGDAIGLSSANALSLGRLNQGLTLSNNGFISLGQPAFALAPTNAYTVMAWIRLPVGATGGTIFSRALADPTQQQLNLAVVNGKLQATVGGTTNSATSTSLNTNVASGRWTLVALVNNGTSNTLYIDGIAKITASNGTATASGVDYLIGARRDTTNAYTASYFTGDIDDVSIFNRALTPTELAAAFGSATGLQTLTTINGMNAYVHLPSDYATTGAQKYPLIVFAPGAGEVGTNAASLLVYGPSYFVNKGDPMEFMVNGVLEKPIVISLQPTAGWPNTTILDNALTTIVNQYRVDTNRIYLTGLSMGGWWHDMYVTQSGTTFPNRPAAVVAMHAVVPDSDHPIPTFSLFANAGGKWWGIEGQNDGRKMDQIAAAMNAAVAGSGRYTQILATDPPTASTNGSTHCCWNNFYNPNYANQNETIYTWMLKQRKGGTVVTPNQPPTANAGTAQSITLPTTTATLTGSGTDSDGTIASYQWSQVSGPTTATITTPTTATTTVTSLTTAGTYTFGLIVKDNQGASSAQSTVSVTVSAQTVNQPPLANAGPDQSITLPTSTATLTGSGTDSDGTIASYQWSQVSGPTTATITTPTTATTTVTGLVQGSYTFRLTVTDNRGATATDDSILTVNSVTSSLVANAGPDQTISRINPVTTLNGSASTGNIVSYKWQLLTSVSDGSYGYISNPNQAVVTVHTLPYKVGGYTFRLTVTDASGATATDDVVVNVAWTTPLPPQKGDKGGWHFVTSATLATDRANTNNLANVGDYIIDGANDGYVINGKKTDIYLSQLNAPASYPGFTIGAGNKILIAPGIYDSVVLEFNQDIVKGASGNPAIITSWGQLEAQSMRIKNIRFTKITGKYVPGVSGSAAYPGHANGYAFSQGKYGIYINNNWSSVVAAGLNIAGEYTNDVEVEYVEAGNGTFSPLTIKDPSATALDYNNISVHDTYLHDTGGEGTYQGQTTADPVHLINGLRFYNNRLIRLGNEGIQIGQQGTNNEIYNNVIIMPATRFRSPFQESQYFGVQLGYRNGGNKFYNNIVLGAGEQLVSVIQTAKTGYPSNGLSNDITNNALQFGKGFIGNYIGEQSALAGVQYNFNDNVVGNFKFRADKVFKTTSPNAVNTQQLLRAGTNNQTVNMLNNIRDNTKTTMIANATTYNVANTTVMTTLPTFTFNSGYGVGFDYTNYDMWGDIIFDTWGDEYANQTSVRQGEPIVFNQGDMVFWMGKTYVSAVNNNTGHMPTGVSDQYWTKLTWTDGTKTYDYAPDDYREASTDYYRARNIGLLDTTSTIGARVATTPTTTAITPTPTTTTTVATPTTKTTSATATIKQGSTVTVTTTKLNVRETAGGVIIGTVVKGVTGSVLSEKTVKNVLWKQVAFKTGITGWVSATYLK